MVVWQGGGGVSEKQMPRVGSPVKLEAALHTMLYATDHYEHPGEYFARWTIYFDAHRCIEYKSRWRLKTKTGAVTRAKRELVQYLQALREQIDEVLPRIERGELDEHDFINVISSAYIGYEPMPDEA